MDGIPLSEWSGSGATKELTKVIKSFNEKTAEQTDKIIKLTVIMLSLTIVMAVSAGVQIWLTWEQLNRP